MRIKVADVLSNKVISIEVDPSVTVRELIEAIIDALKLPRNYMYSLVYASKEIGPDKYDMTLRDLGVREDDEIQIVGRPQGG